MSQWGLTPQKRYRPATRYCVNCGLSVSQCRDLFFSRWCRLSSSHSWTKAIRHSSAFQHISCHGCSLWWTPPLGLSFPRQSSSTSLRSFVSCTVWRLQSRLHSNMQPSCTSVYTGLHLQCIRYWRALSGGRCRGWSATPFQFILVIVSRTRLPTVGDRARSPLHVSGTVYQILSLLHLP